MQGKRPAAFCAGPFLAVLLQKGGHALFLRRLAVFQQAGVVPFVIAFLQVFNQLAGKLRTFKAAHIPLLLRAGFDVAPAAVFGLAQIPLQAALAGFCALENTHMPIAHRAVHPTGRQHAVFYFGGHFHGRPPSHFSSVPGKAYYWPTKRGQRESLLSHCRARQAERVNTPPLAAVPCAQRAQGAGLAPRYDAPHSV